MKKLSLVFTLVAAVGVGSAVLVEAQGRGNNKPPKAGKQQEKQGKARERGDRTPDIDRDAHRRVIREYRTEGLPPGLAKRESLPPGLRKQLRERGELPPGLQKRLVPVPRALESRLPRLPRQYERHFAGDDLIVVDRETNRIVAIIPDVLR